MAQAKRKKKFFEVEMALIKKEAHLLAYEPTELKGRTIIYDLTRILKGKSILAEFKVYLDEGKPKTKIMSIRILPYFLRRMVRKGTDYVEDSLTINAKDAQIQIKPFLITRRRVSRRVKKGLREKAKEELENYLKEKYSEDIFDEIFKNKLQKEISLKLKKIYPLSLCEIRTLKVIKELDVPEHEKIRKKLTDDSKDQIDEEIKSTSMTASGKALKAKEKSVKKKLEESEDKE